MLENEGLLEHLLIARIMSQCYQYKEINKAQGARARLVS